MTKLCKRCGAKMWFQPGRKRGGSWWCSQDPCPASKIASDQRGQLSRRRREKHRRKFGVIHPSPSPKPKGKSVWDEIPLEDIVVEITIPKRQMARG